MMLNQKIAQSIVDKTMSIIGVNVNIMDADAMVIASGQPGRVGQFHGGANQVLKTKKMLRITSQDTEKLEGVMPGITLPIFFNGEIVGAVGMTGEPDEIINYGELVRHTTELMLEQAYLKEEIYLADRAREIFLYDLLTGNCGGDDAYFTGRAHAFGYDLRRSYLVMVLEPVFWLEDNGEDSSRQIVAFHRLEEYLAQELRRWHRYPGIITCLINRGMAVLVPTQKKGALLGDREQQEALSAQLVRLAEARLETGIVAGLGGSSDDWRNLWQVYNQARDAIRLGKIFGRGDSIYYFQDFLTEHAMCDISEEMRTAYYNSIFGELMKKPAAQRELLFNTLSTYFELDMSLGKTAEALYIHRNTLMLRLNKIQELTGCQPQSFQGAFKLRMAMILSQMR